MRARLFLCFHMVKTCFIQHTEQLFTVFFCADNGNRRSTNYLGQLSMNNAAGPDGDIFPRVQPTDIRAAICLRYDSTAGPLVVLEMKDGTLVEQPAGRFKRLASDLRGMRMARAKTTKVRRNKSKAAHKN